MGSMVNTDVHSMVSVEEASEVIASGRHVLVSGDENLLSQLPKGSWVGGTTPYFMTYHGGRFSQDELQALVLPEFVTDVDVSMYGAGELPLLCRDYKKNGFSYIVIPAFSKAHERFAEDCSTWPGIFNSPLVGWISGVPVEEIGRRSPKVFNGRTGEVSDCKAVVMHAELAADRYARADIVNLFRQGGGETITFPESGLAARECFVDGRRTSLAKYIAGKGIDTQFPLVADYMGAMVNVSFQSVDEANDCVKFYAPVFPGVEYKVAQPVTDYAAEFCREIEGKPEPFFTCNCILNYLYAHLEGKRTGPMVGPITFGEIAYMLLNQTLAHLTFGCR